MSDFLLTSAEITAPSSLGVSGAALTFVSNGPFSVDDWRRILREGGQLIVTVKPGAFEATVTFDAY